MEDFGQGHTRGSTLAGELQGLRGKLCLFTCEAMGKSIIGMEKVNLYHTVYDGYSFEPGFGEVMGKPRSLC